MAPPTTNIVSFTVAAEVPIRLGLTPSSCCAGASIRRTGREWLSASEVVQKGAPSISVAQFNFYKGDFFCATALIKIKKTWACHGTRLGPSRHEVMARYQAMISHPNID